VVVLLWVWIAVAVVAVVVLAGLGYGVAGAFGRLEREMQAFEGEVRPVLGRLQEGLAKAAETASRRSIADAPDPWRTR
jgi:hypothetical protein